MKIDMHCHSSEGSPCSAISISQIIESAKNSDLDGIVITDHETIDGYKSIENKEDLGVKVFAGFEYTTQDGDFLVILPNDEEYISYDMHMTAEKLVEIVHSLNGVVGIAHMFKDCFSVGNILDEEKLIEVIKQVDFVEVNNGRCPQSINQKALEYAKKYNKFQTYGSDAHNIGEIGKKYTSFSSDIKHNSELVEYILSQKAL